MSRKRSLCLNLPLEGGREVGGVRGQATLDQDDGDPSGARGSV